jgi:hypothetical protein|tara:strand:- start:219 stop:428 length:210 start_codon:yes stop_codon:yes gene_type:complete
MNYTKKIIPNAAGNAEGQVGEGTLWDGPLSQVGRPHGKGSSSGINGMQVLKYPSPYESKPITQCAKGRI